ncbi:AAA family ATPase [Sediminispirochaeta bajacaliforniensis]|uniref:AAA family ATPase n=1 Tax=Sediminispirochaeta bajacaliforniensis TaxID=148 RepID=UPI0009D9FD54|nr:ATP-binding protein [Sediminispirochaeta bajacaliforniensis]
MSLSGSSYGGNASGKTNFFKAINFAKHFIIKGSLPDYQINIEPFLLDEVSRTKPVVFIFEILVEDDIYEFLFSLTTKEVLEEKLIKVTSTSEKLLYHRHHNDPNPQFHSSIRSKRLEFAFEGTRENQLFLTNSVSQKLAVFAPVYNWFAQTLVLVAPDTRFESFEHFVTEGSHLYETMNAILPNLDTGICHLGGEEISMDSLPLPETLKQKLKKDAREGLSIKLNNDDEKIVITRQNGELNVKKLYTYHQNTEGTNTRFEMRQESDGSKRIIDLLPAFLDLAETGVPKVYIIDEIDRSLHSLLTRQLLEVFLSSCTETNRKQLLFTTHDLLLMNQSIFRRDEIWITERKPDGSSEMISFSEYEVTAP